MTREELIEAGRNAGYAFAVIHTYLHSDRQVHLQVEYASTEKEAVDKMMGVSEGFIAELEEIK